MVPYKITYPWAITWLFLCRRALMYFSRTEGFILKDNLNGSEKTKLATTTMQTAGWQSVVDGRTRN